MNPQGGGGDPLKELFNWAVANSSSEELRRQAADSTGNPQELTPEKREILEYIASQMKGSDPYTVIKKALAVIRDESSSVDDTLDAMDQIDEIVGKIDFATDFHKMKGTEYIFDHFLSSESQDERADEIEIKLASLQILCTCLHNNPAIQTDDLYQVKFFNYLADILDNPSSKGKAILKKVGSSLAALSSNQPNTLKQFNDRHIIGKITKIMHTEQDEQVLSKFMFSLLNVGFDGKDSSIP
ncbi:predicted protein [Naegleria gruberi]|uniref:Predicted protein n=1 Tax=Naegleria gruberi TaxID=5762 RepID=D2VN59_NAEGR|nr:uncharacterized protein NAEGRDRAFT_58729 [Naegleria gruberi]EFC41686.1 predicted protein [Naegleria gruberi]|eukprot:XP_002674430.1 predicted protein [Naegleria gruberi strain NEG-M]